MTYGLLRSFAVALFYTFCHCEERKRRSNLLGIFAEYIKKHGQSSAIRVKKFNPSKNYIQINKMDFKMVEAAGIEPASEDLHHARLHA